MKKILVLSILAMALGLGGWFYQDTDARPCLEDWIAQTQSLFNDATLSLKNLSNSNKPPISQDDLDDKLQALLPSDSVDLSYQAIGEQGQTLAQGDNSDLLPNLFQSQQQKSTSLSGQVHMDENDNIIGAEVQVSIPTNL